ncbi:MAG: HlyC/CorC family transporter [Chloroflexi bacterium]|nr:HlyC/CorC family transporter [Chloroflexota bacterium]
MEDGSRWLALAVVLLFLMLLWLVSATQEALAGLNLWWRQKSLTTEEGNTHQLLGKDDAVSGALTLARILAVGIIILASSYLGTGPWWWTSSVLTVAFLVIAVVLWSARATGAAYPESTLASLNGPVMPVIRLLAPMSGLLSSVIERVLPVAVVRKEEAKPGDTSAVTGQEETAEKEAELMIRGIFQLGRTSVREIMVPRIDIQAVDTEASFAQVVDQIIELGYSRLPLYEEIIDRIVGIIYAKDILAYLQRGILPTNLKDVARSAYFVPETKKIGELLRELQQKKIHMAIVVDEYGGTAGLVTMEDLLEEIVGEIEDEYERGGEALVQKLSDQEAIVDARVSIDEMNDLFRLNIESEDFDTVGGFVYSRLGKIASIGDEIQADGVLISVLSMEGRRIKKVRVTKDIPQD